MSPKWWPFCLSLKFVSRLLWELLWGTMHHWCFSVLTLILIFNLPPTPLPHKTNKADSFTTISVAFPLSNGSTLDCWLPGCTIRSRSIQAPVSGAYFTHFLIVSGNPQSQFNHTYYKRKPCISFPLIAFDFFLFLQPSLFFSWQNSIKFWWVYTFPHPYWKGRGNQEMHMIFSMDEKVELVVRFHIHY